MHQLKKILTALVLVWTFHWPAAGQNLVMNPGFEDSLKCPSGSGAFTTYVAVWTKPTYASSDYFYAGCPVAPTNEPPHGGNAYAGIIVYDPANYREYITGTLTAPLLAGVTYEISFFVSLLDNCIDGISELGAWFTNTLPSYANANPILLTPQFQHASPLFLDTGWTQVKGYFQAAGGEQHLTIGAFVPDSSMTFTPAPGTNSWFDVYYFIDDVSVRRDSVTAVADPGWDDLSVDVFPVPAGTVLHISMEPVNECALIIADPSGRVLQRRDFSGRADIDCSRWPPGVYFYLISRYGETLKRGRFLAGPR